VSKHALLGDRLINYRVHLLGLGGDTTTFVEAVPRLLFGMEMRSQTDLDQKGTYPRPPTDSSKPSALCGCFKRSARSG